MAQNSSDNLPSYPPDVADDHNYSDDMLSTGGHVVTSISGLKFNDESTRHLTFTRKCVTKMDLHSVTMWTTGKRSCKQAHLENIIACNYY